MWLLVGRAGEVVRRSHMNKRRSSGVTLIILLYTSLIIIAIKQIKVSLQLLSQADFEWFNFISFVLFLVNSNY